MALLLVLTSAAACWWLLWRLIPLLQRQLPDQPNARSAHQLLTPRGGGVAFVVIATCVSGGTLLAAGGLSATQLPLLALPLLALPLALVGLLDDWLDLPAYGRYGAQLATALALVALSPLARSLAGGWLLASLLLLIAVTAVINFTNFMDGLDGLVAGCLVVTLAAATLKLAAPWPLWALVGALLGFLLWNWSPAKVFMGDVGSTFLGAVLAGVVLQAPSWPEALGLLLVATPLLADACLCVPRRLLAGQQIFKAHRLHLFQRLHQAGWPHARVALLYIAATTLLALALLLGGWLWVLPLASVELLIGIWLDQTVAVPFVMTARR